MAEFTKMLPLIFHFAAGVYGKNGQDLSLPYEGQFELARKTGWRMTRMTLAAQQ